MAPVGDDQGNKHGRPGDSSEDQLHNPYIVTHPDGPGVGQVPAAFKRRVALAPPGHPAEQ